LVNQLFLCYYYIPRWHEDDRDLLAERPRLIIIGEVSMDKYNGERDILYIIHVSGHSSDLTWLCVYVWCTHTHTRTHNMYINFIEHIHCVQCSDFQ